MVRDVANNFIIGISGFQHQVVLNAVSFRRRHQVIHILTSLYFHLLDNIMLSSLGEGDGNHGVFEHIFGIPGALFDFLQIIFVRSRTENLKDFQPGAHALTQGNRIVECAAVRVDTLNGQENFFQCYESLVG